MGKRRDYFERLVTNDAAWEYLDSHMYELQKNRRSVHKVRLVEEALNSGAELLSEVPSPVGYIKRRKPRVK